MADRLRKSEQATRDHLSEKEELSRDLRKKEDLLKFGSSRNADLRDSQAKDYENRLEELHKELKDKESKLREKDTMLKDSRKEVEELSRKLRVVELEMDNLDSFKRKHEESIVGLEDQLKELMKENTENLNRAENEHEETAKRLADVLKQLKDSKQQVDDLYLEMDNIKLDQEKQADNQSGKFKSEIEILKGIHSKQLDHSKNLETNLKNVLADLSEANNQIKNLKQQNEKIRDSMRSDQTDNGKLKTLIADLQKELGENDVLIKKQNLELRNVRVENEKGKKELERLKERQALIDEADARTRDELRKRKDECGRLKDECDKLKRSLHTQENEVERLNDTVGRLKESIDTKTKDHSECLKALKETREKLREISKAKDAQKLEVGSYQKKLTDSEAGAEKLRSQITSSREIETNLRSRIEDLRAKNIDLEKKLKAVDQDAKNRIKQKEKQVRDLTNLLNREKEENASIVRQSNQESEQELEDLRADYEQRITQLQDEKVQLEEDHLAEITRLQELQLKELREIILKNNENIGSIKRESDEETARMARRLEDLQAKLMGSKDSTQGNPGESYDDLLAIRLKQEKAHLERKHQNEIDKLIFEKVELQKALSMANREVTRLREMYESLKHRIKSEVSDISGANSRKGSINMIQGNRQPVVKRITESPEFKRADYLSHGNQGYTRRSPVDYEDEHIEEGRQPISSYYESQNPLYSPRDGYRVSSSQQGDAYGRPRVGNTYTTPDQRSQNISTQPFGYYDQYSDSQSHISGRSRQTPANSTPSNRRHTGRLPSEVRPLDVHQPNRYPADPISWSVKKKPGYLQTLTSLRKARILNNALIHLMSNYKFKAFSKIHGAKIMKLRAWGEAGSRIKGRLLVLLRSRHEDTGARRSFLKWAVLSNREFVRDCITKIPINSKLCDHSVFWRFRKLIQKRLRPQVPETAKTSRIVLASYILHYWMMIKQRSVKTQTFNMMKPHTDDPERNRMMGVLARIIEVQRLNTLDSLRRMQVYKSKKDHATSTLVRTLEHKLLYALEKMRTTCKLSSGLNRNGESESDYLHMASALRRVAKSSINSTLGLSDLHSTGLSKSLLLLMARRSALAKQSEALNRLSQHMGESKKESDLKKNMINKLLSRSIGNTDRSTRDAFDKLRAHHIQDTYDEKMSELHADNMQASQGLKLKFILTNLYRSQEVKLRISLNMLRDSCLLMASEEDKILAQQKREDSSKNKFVRQLVYSLRQKMSMGFKKLVQNNRMLADFNLYKKKRTQYLITRIVLGNQAQQKHCFDKLVNNRKHAIELEDARKKLRLSLCNNLFRAQISKLRDSLGRLRHFTRTQIQELEAIAFNAQQEKIQTSKIQRKLVSATEGKLRQCLLNAISLNRASSVKAAQSGRTKNSVLAKLIAASGLKVRICMNNLIQNRLERQSADEKAKLKDKLEKALKNKLFHKLAGIAQTNLQTGLQGLKDHAAFRIGVVDYTNRKKISLITRLIASLQMKERLALGEFSRNKVEIDASRLEELAEEDRIRMWSERSRSMRAIYLSQLFNALNGKLRQSFERFMDFKRFHIQREHELNRCFNNLFSRLTNASSVKQRICFDDLIQNSLQISMKENQQAEDLRKVIQAGSRLIGKLVTYSNLKTSLAMDKLSDNRRVLMEREDLQRAKSKVMLNKLLNSFNIKLDKALTKLQDNQITQTRQDSKKAALFNKLVNSLNSKMKDTIIRLVSHNHSKAKDRNIYILQVKSILAKLLGQIGYQRELAMRGGMRRLRNNASEGQANDERKNISLNILSQAQKAKLKEAMFQFKSHNLYTWGETRLNDTLMENMADQNMRIMSRSFKRMYYALNKKCIIALRQMRYWNEDFKDTQSKQDQIMDWLANRASELSRQKKEESLRKMKAYSQAAKKTERHFRKMMNRIANKLRTTGLHLYSETMNRLKKHSQDVEDEGRWRRMVFNSLMSRLANSLDGKVSQVFNTLRGHAIGSSDRNKKFRLARSRLINALLKGLRGKQMQALSSIVRVGTARNMLMQRQYDSSIHIIRMLRTSILSKLDRALTQLRGNRREQERIEREKTLFFKMVNSHFVISAQHNQKIAMLSLQENSNLALLKERRGRSALSQLIRRVLSYSLDSLANGMHTLRLINAIENQKRVKEEAIKKKLLEQLLRKSHDKVRSAYSNISRYSVVVMSSKETERIKLNRLMNKLVRAQISKQNSAYSSLELYALRTRVTTLIQTLATEKLSHTTEMNLAEADNSLKLNCLVYQHSEDLRNQKLKSLLLAHRKALQAHSYSRLERNWRERTRLIDLLSKFNSKIRQNAISYGLSKWRNRQQAERRHDNQTRISMLINNIEKNLKTIAKMAINKWAAQNRLQKVAQGRMANIFEGLVRLRERQAFDRIKYYSEVIRQEEKLRALRDMISTIEAAKFRQKADIFYGFKRRLVNENKWFKKVIYLWTQKSHITYNISFWRIRDEKALGLSSVETSKAVKLKNLATMFHNKEQNLKASILSAISYYSLNRSWHFSQMYSTYRSQLPPHESQGDQEVDMNRTTIQDNNLKQSVLQDDNSKEKETPKELRTSDKSSFPF